MKTKLFHAGRSTLSVVLAVMMLLSTMLMGSLSTVTAATVGDGSVAAPASDEVGGTMSTDTTYTVYFYNSSSSGSWSNVYAYAWDSDGNNNATWPGVQMSKVDGTTNIYSVSISSAATTVIFDSGNGGTQTNNLTLPTSSPNWTTNDALYDYSTSTWTSYSSFSEGSSSTTSYEVVGTLTGATWTLGSGYAMTESNGTYVASFAVSASTTYYFKINDRSNTDWSKTYFYSSGNVTSGTTYELSTGDGNGTAINFAPTSDGTATITFTPGTSPTLTVTYPSNGSSSSGSGYYLFGDGDWTTGVELDSNYSVTVTSTTGINLTNGFLISKTSDTSGNVKAGAGDDTGCTLVKDGDNLKISSFDDGYGYPVTLTYNSGKGTVSAVATEGSSSSTATIFYSTETSAESYKTNATAVAPTETQNDDGSVTYSCTFNTIGGDSGLPVKTNILFTYADTASTSSVWAESSNGFHGGVEGYISTGDFGINNYYENDDGSYTNVKACKVYIQNTDVASVTVSVTKNSAGTAIGWNVTGTYNATARLVAKNGTIRTDSNSNYNSITDDMGTTTVTYDNTYIDDGVTIDESSYQRKVVKMTEAAINKGLDLTISTQMTDTAFANYYIAGYVIDGETYALQEDAIADYDKATQTVSFTYRVPLTTEKDDVIEVTPVYFMKSSDTIRFYVEDYENVKNAWGDTLACYAYYSTGENDSASFNQANGFGCYPGQPMLKTGGRYFYDLPSSVNGKTIKGITLNNYKWDDVHGSLVGSTNYQTYDYSDFGTIYNQKIATLSSTATKPDIIFAFKYTAENTGTDHFGDGVTIENGKSTTTPNSAQKSDTALGNVTENLTDFYGDRVDLFHTNIETKSTVSNNPWIAISNGYENCNDSDVGYYATRWAIYKPSSETGSDCSYSYVTSINSASLFYSSAGDLTSAGYTTEATAYTTLLNEGAENQPVVISYEKEITRATSLDGTSADGDQTGARSDGVWYYSEPDITVTAHTAVQYAQTYSSTGYSDSDYTTDWYLSTTTSGWDYEDTANYDPDSTEYYKGYTTGLEAYFNFSDDDGTNFWHKTAATLSTESTKKFVFYAQPKTYNGKTYQFDGWYLYNASSNTYTLISTEQNYYTDPVNNDLYVARFSPVPTDGALTVNHYFDSANSTGTAEVNVKVEVVDTDNNVQYTNSGTNTATVPQSTGWINSESNNNVVITLTTTPGTGVTFEEFEELVDGVIKSLGTSETDLVVETGSSINYDVDGSPYTATIKFPVKSLFNDSNEQTISSLTYYSKTSVDFKLQIDYKYDTRYYGTKVYQVISKNYYTSVNSAAETVTLDSDFASKYIVSDGNDGYKVTTDCITEYAPDVTNFNQNISWNVSSATQTYNNGLIYVKLTATQEDDLERTASITVYDANGNESVVTATGKYPKDVSETSDQTLGQSYHFKDSGGNSVSTARTYTMDGVTYKFSYWDVKTTDNVAVTKVYPDKDGTGDIYFGYSAFDNYTVTAVYNSTVDPKGSITASVQELADTRNQWNNTVSGETDTQSGNKIVYGEYNNATTKYDRLYIDFALAFKVVDSENNVVQLNTTTGYSVGLVVVNANASVTESDIKAAINGTSTNGVIVKSIATSKLTNKNRIEYCLGYSNADAVKDANLTVYSYIVDTDGNVTLSAALTGVDYSDCTADTTD